MLATCRGFVGAKCTRLVLDHKLGEGKGVHGRGKYLPNQLVPDAPPEVSHRVGVAPEAHHRAIVAGVTPDAEGDEANHGVGEAYVV